MPHYLLDTHTLLWWLDNTSPLSSEVRGMIDDPSHNVSVSVVTIWEIAIKKSLGKLNAPDDLLDILEKNRMEILPITAHHAYTVRSLPLLHGDPFDRMLIVQAMLEDLTIMTHDKQISAYPISCMMV